MAERLSPQQNCCLESIVDILAACPTIVLERESLVERWGFTLYEAEQLIAAVGLLFIKTLPREKREKYLKLQGEFAAKLFNRPSYSKATKEMEDGFVHHQQRFSKVRGSHRKG